MRCTPCRPGRRRDSVTIERLEMVGDTVLCAPNASALRWANITAGVCEAPCGAEDAEPLGDGWRPGQLGRISVELVIFSCTPREPREQEDGKYRESVTHGGAYGVEDEFRGEDGPNHEVSSMQGGAQGGARGDERPA